MMNRTTLRHLVPNLVGLSALIAAGCGGDEKSSTSPPRLTGHLHYESVPYDATNDGLDYSNITARPIRGARVLLLDAANDKILDETTSSNEGTYSFHWSGSPSVKIWVYAETVQPAIVIADNTAQNAKYVLESNDVVADTTKTLDVLAESGWTGNSYGKPRQAAPFAILDGAYTAAKRFLDEGKPAPTFPKLEINWSVENRPENGSINLGQIGTSYWDGSEIYILGKEDVDTDEYDTHVIVHEWGHSFEDRISRSDSPGGPHGFGDVLDPRIAFSEGFCNALSAIILDPDTIYSDSSGLRQDDGFWEDLDANDTSAGANPGWYSETTVGNLVFDLYDNNSTGAEDFDKVALGIPGIYAAMVGKMKTTAALTTIFPFVAALKGNHPEAAIAIDTLVTYHENGGSFGINPIVDDWGTNETHGGSEPNAIPVYIGMKIGDSKTLTLTGGLDWSYLGQNRFMRFTGNGASVTISTTSANDVDLFVYRNGVEIKSAMTTSGNESLTYTTKMGDEYVINVQGYGQSSGSYSVTVKVSP